MSTAKLAWHLFSKDLRRDRGWVIFWVLLFGAHIGVGGLFLRMDGRDLERIDQLRWVGMLLTIFQVVVGFLIALRWMQADEAVGTRMFWVTRPIAGGKMFAAKALGSLTLFGMGPVVLWIPWWLQCGVPLNELGWLAAETFGWQLLLIAPAWLIGSLTDDLGRAIMWALILVAAAFAWAYIGQSMVASPIQFSRTFAGLWFSRILIAAGLVVLGFIAIAAAQYCSRNLARSLVRVGAIAGLVLLIGWFWIIDISVPFATWGQPGAPGPTPNAGENIVLTATEARLSRYRYRQSTPHGPEDVRTLIVSIDVAGLPANLMLRAEHSSQSLVWAGEPPVQSAERRGSAVGPRERILRDHFALPEVLPDPETIRWGRERLRQTNLRRARSRAWRPCPTIGTDRRRRVFFYAQDFPFPFQRWRNSSRARPRISPTSKPIWRDSTFYRKCPSQAANAGKDRRVVCR